MQDHCSYDYAVVRVVPRVDREEFVNAGVIVSCQSRGFLEARIELDTARPYERNEYVIAHYGHRHDRDHDD